MGTWLSCEETEAKAGSGTATKDHGYVFEVDPYLRSANRDPQPIKALGRFSHEAVVVDPRTGDIYLTEDAVNPNGLLYRWKAPEDHRPGRGRLRALSATAGVLSAMRATDGAGAHVDDLSRASEIGTVYAITWVPVPDRDAVATSTRMQFAGRSTRWTARFSSPTCRSRESCSRSPVLGAGCRRYRGSEARAIR